MRISVRIKSCVCVAYEDPFVDTLFVNHIILNQEECQKEFSSGIGPLMLISSLVAGYKLNWSCRD